MNAFATDLIEDIAALRKATPATSVDGNLDTIKHLKSRKRNLFSETLKAVRLMGFRSNIGANVFNTQNSVEAVLSRSPVFEGPQQTMLARADQYFDLFLNTLPQARQSATKHSEDLTNNEVLRGVGYLESILSTITKQRATLSRALEDYEKIEAVSTVMSNLWAPEKHTICPLDEVNIRQVNDLHHVARWLPTILEVGCTILEVHSKLGGTSITDVLHNLRQWQKKAHESCVATAGLPELPNGVFSTQHVEIAGRHQEEMEALRFQLHNFTEEYPNLSYVFNQIELWTKTDELEGTHAENDVKTSSISDFDTSISNVVDSILVALQHMSEALSSVPSGAQDARWLLSLEISLSNSLSGLHSREVERLLSGAMSGIQYLDPTNPKSFKVASAICGTALPIVRQYTLVQKIALERYSRFHLEYCRLASILAKSFSEVAEEGFCSPPECSASEQEGNEKLEGGIGLGEGGGAEDISKDIQDDEDLSELAQQNKKDEGEHEMEDQDDAVNMDHDEMEGEREDAHDQSDGEDASDAQDDGDMDDEIGNVDDLDPGAVDEKLWDGREEEHQKEKQNKEMENKSDEDGTAAVGTEEREQKSDEPETKDKGTMEEQDLSDDGDDEGEEVAQKEVETVDPRVQEGPHLDIPEEMDLDNMDNSQGSASEDDEIENMSGLEDEKGEADSLADDASSHEKEDADKLEASDHEVKKEEDEDMNEGSRAGSPVDTEPEEGSISQEDKEHIVPDRTDTAETGTEDAAAGAIQGLDNSGEQRQDKERMPGSTSQGSEGAGGAPSNQNDQQTGVKGGETSDIPAAVHEERAEDGGTQGKNPTQAFKKLGDALEEWHQQNSQIQDASNPNRKNEHIGDNEKTQEDFEHLGHDQEESKTQALGAASEEQARPLDDTVIDSEMLDEPRTFAPENDLEKNGNDDAESKSDDRDLQSTSQKLREQTRPGAFAGNSTRAERESDQASAAIQYDDLMSIEDLDYDLSSTSLQTDGECSKLSMEDARQLWLHHEARTRELSLSLTERLRLILAPTMATKMRGDFRTGKRLNIKRIIPYIASNFKRDKIWMRRSIPSKRSYQIMLAVDDSKSMSESESGQLAFQTLALIAKSLSMLEAGEICVVGFGNDVFVAHDFDTPFSAEAGATIIKRFNFQQESTNIRRLVAESISLFRQARLKTSRSGQDLWQLELIISDGVCEDHKTIKQLVRQATEQRIMIVFVIVDALLKEESIMDMRQAIFEPDNTTGEKKVQIKRYMDDFPFTYYLVVGNVGELPGVLAQALRQWFAEVSGD